MILKLNEQKDNLKLIQIDNDLYLIDVKAKIKENGSYAIYDNGMNIPFIVKSVITSSDIIYREPHETSDDYGSEEGGITPLKHYISKIIASTNKRLDGCLLIQSKEDEVELPYQFGENLTQHQKGRIVGYKEGYKANKVYSEEQIREAIEMAINYGRKLQSENLEFEGDIRDIDILYERGKESIVQSFSQPQVEITFENNIIKSVKQIQ